MSMSRQCKLLNINRTSIYYKPKGESKLNKKLKILIKEKFKKHPYYGVPQMHRWLQIDTVGYGIHTMYIEQRKRFFPLPDYSGSKDNKIIFKIYGHAIDENYSLLLMNRSDLPLSSGILLDRVLKKLPIPQQEANNLRNEGLIEGRKPNYYITAKIAEKTNIKADYIKIRGFDDKYFKNMMNI